MANKRRISGKLGISIGAIIVLIILARVSGMIQYYSVPTPSNSPAIDAGDHVLATNLKSCEPGDFVVFKKDYQGSGKDVFYTKRLCGVSGDTIEIKKGRLFRNGKNFDEGLELKYLHSLPEGEYTLKSLEKFGVKLQDILLPPAGLPNAPVRLVTLTMEQAKQIAGAERQLNFYSVKNTAYEFFGNDITNQTVGPFVVPESSCFVVGDNRDNSLDSRYFGFVKEEKIVGTVFKILKTEN